MVEVIIIISIALILWLFLRKMPQIKDSELRIGQQKESLNWVSVRRKIRAFFRGGYRNFSGLILRKKKRPAKKKRVRRIKINVPKSYLKAQTLFQKGELEKAEKVCLRLITLRPAEARLYHLLSQIYQGKKSFKDAVMALKEAVKLKEDSFWMVELARLYQKKKDYPKAEETLKKAIKLNNTIAKRFAILARIQLKLDKKREAQENIERALKIEPHNSGYHELKKKILG